MYYRILEEDLNSYSPFGYNQSSKESFKKDVEHLLTESLAYLDVIQVCSLKWDQFKVRLKSYGLIVEECPVPFEPVDSVDWNFDNDDDDMFGGQDFDNNY
jgi:hypothetical protein